MLTCYANGVIPARLINIELRGWDIYGAKITVRKTSLGLNHVQAHRILLALIHQSHYPRKTLLQTVIAILLHNMPLRQTCTREPFLTLARGCRSSLSRPPQATISDTPACRSMTISNAAVQGSQPIGYWPCDCDVSILGLKRMPCGEPPTSLGHATIM